MNQHRPCPEQCADTVPIKVNRVFDSCSDRDCFSNVQVSLCGASLPDNITLVKSRCVQVSDICMSIEPVPFNRGFYAIDLTYTFQVELIGYERSCSSCSTLLTGTAYANKSVILYGGESSTKTFFSNGEQIGETNSCCETINLPTAAVQVVEPITLETRIVCTNDSDCGKPTRNIVMTLGLFSVVELLRPVTILVPTYEYTIPTKECHTDSESPCAVFDKIRFPAEEFSPSTLNASSSGQNCPKEEKHCWCTDDLPPQQSEQNLS